MEKTIMTKLKTTFFLLFACVFLASCSSEWEPEPIGIGGDPSELKRSPCACMPIDFERSVPDWFIEETV